MSSSGTQSRSPDRDLEQVIKATVALARSHGADKAACATLERLATRWQSPQLPVVVVGEVSRGKSTLINALLGQDLLPSDFRAWSSAWVRVSHGPQLRASVTIANPDGTPEEVPLNLAKDLPVYLTIEGNARFLARHGRGARVLSVEMQVPAPLLESGLELIDTPGVGGLAAAHRRAALSALIEADAVLFVTKPGEPISRSEREFLAEAVERVSVCVVVQTHRDQVADPDSALAEDLALLGDADQWRTLLADPGGPDQSERARQLATRLGDESQAVSVSALNALAALKLPDPAKRQELLDASNIRMLQEVLTTDVIAVGHRIHRDNVRGLAETLLQDIRRPAVQRIAMLRGDAEALTAIEEREARIDRWVEHNGDYWRREFDDSEKQLLRDIAAKGSDLAQDLRREYRRRFAKMRIAAIREEMQPLLGEPGTALAELTALGRSRTQQDISRIRQLLDHDGLGETLARIEQTKAVFERLSGQGGLDSETAFDPDLLIKVVQGGLAATAVTGLAAIAAQGAGIMSAGAAVPFLWPFVAGAALFMGASHLRTKRSRTVEEAMEVVTVVCREIETTAVTITTKAVRDARAAVAREIEGALAELAARVQRDRAELDESATTTPEERAAATNKSEEDLRSADELLAELAAHGLNTA